MSSDGKAIGVLERCLAVVCAMMMFASCAARLPAVPPAALKHPDFLFPSVPQDLQRTLAARHLERGWQYLQSDDLSNAEIEFRAALVQTPGFVPAQAGQGYLALAKRDYGLALAGFDVALRSRAGYAPALVGRGQSLLALKRDDEAIGAFEAALAADPSLTDLRRRVEVIRFRGLQDTIDAASASVAAGRLDEARAAYRPCTRGVARKRVSASRARRRRTQARRCPRRPRSFSTGVSARRLRRRIADGPRRAPPRGPRLCRSRGRV